MFELKIGDKVTIRRDLEHKEYGLNTAVPDMIRYAGLDATIRGYAITKKDNYHLDIDSGKWNWDINMFESVESVKDEEVSKEECKVESHEYNEGDVVIIRDDLTPGTYGEVDFVLPMSEYLGKRATIEEIDEEGDFSLDVDGGKFYWSKEMVRPLEKVDTIDYECEYFRLVEVVNEYEDIIDELEEELKESELNNLVLTEKYNSLVNEYNNLLTLHTNSLIENAKLKEKTTI